MYSFYVKSGKSKEKKRKRTEKQKENSFVRSNVKIIFKKKGGW